MKVNIHKKIYNNFSCIKQSVHLLFDQRPAYFINADMINEPIWHITFLGSKSNKINQTNMVWFNEYHIHQSELFGPIQNINQSSF